MVCQWDGEWSNPLNSRCVCKYDIHGSLLGLASFISGEHCSLIPEPPNSSALLHYKPPVEISYEVLTGKEKGIHFEFYS